MSSETCIIVTGNPVDGAEFVGPFPSVAEASEYAGRFVGCEYWIASVDPPAMETSASVNRKVASGEWDSMGGSLVTAAAEMLDALRQAVKPLERLGDFIGNVDAGGASGLGPFDRCEILLAVRRAIAKAEGRA